MTSETDGEFLARLGTDAAKWAAEFCKLWPSALCQIPGKEGVEDGANFEATMIGWFANAIETAKDSVRAPTLATEHAALQDDGRPCNTDVFLAAAMQAFDDKWDFYLAVKDWVEGDWDGALTGIDRSTLTEAAP